MSVKLSPSQSKAVVFQQSRDASDCRQLVLVTDCLQAAHKDASAKNFKLAAKRKRTQRGGGGIHSSDFKTKASRDLHFE